MQNKLVNHTKKKSHDGLKMVLCLRLKSQIRLLDDVVTTFPGTAFLSLFETFKFKSYDDVIEISYCENVTP